MKGLMASQTTARCVQEHMSYKDQKEALSPPNQKRQSKRTDSDDNNPRILINTKTGQVFCLSKLFKRE